MEVGKDKEQNKRRELNSVEIGQLLRIGLRPIEVTEELRGDLVGGCLLIPTKDGDKWRNIPDPGWEGSDIPLLIYKDNSGCILVSHGAEEMWKELADKLSEIFQMPVRVRGD